MSFCTAINCMDGRVQKPMIAYLEKEYAVDYVDMITEPGPVLILAEKQQSSLCESILSRVNISVDKHSSKNIAVAGHYDCTGNPADEATQRQQIQQSVEFLKSKYNGVEITGLWINEGWVVEKVV